MEPKLHHVGYVVTDIAAAADHYAAWLGLELIGDITEDTTQRAKVAFLGTNSDVSVELIEALDEFAHAARAIRVLADYLERNPQALLQGKRGPGGQ